MRIYTLVLICFFTAGSVFSQKAPSLAPLNPDFVRFMAEQKNGEHPLPADGFGNGGMPPPGIVSFDNYLENNKLKSTTFDAVYDMRSTGLLTPVRAQTVNGCWAYATMASVESKWLGLGLGVWDLSENNLKYCHGFADSRSYYGNHYMSTAYFARRSGPLIESDDPNTGGSPAPGVCPTGKTPVAYITDARYLPNDMNTIKQAILDQGAIYTMMYINQSSSYYDATNYTYYYNGAAEVNHCVALVGWNDNKVTAGGTGAWICKNSYGAVWGELGYFYVSYNDYAILDYNAYWPVRLDNTPNSQVYGYDDLGNYDGVGYDSTVGYMLVKYVATAKQLLSKVGTYTLSANSTIGIDVYDNFDPVSLVPSVLLSRQEGLACEMPGYYTFDLPAPISVEEGDDFYIRIRYQTPDSLKPIPIEYAILDYSTPFIESNIAWTSGDGKNGSWFLIGNTTTNEKYDPCVKVYAESLLTWNGTVSDDWNTAANWSPASVPDASRHVVIGGAVAFNPIINSGADAFARSVELLPEANLTVSTGKTLTIGQNFTMRSDISGTASFISDDPLKTTVESYIPGNAWHLISSPVSNTEAGMFTGKYLQKHTESTNAYTDIISTSEALTPAKGYALWGDASGFTAQYNGLLNTGIQSAELTRSSTGDNSGWNLVGNPYPSSIDWDAAAGWTKTNLNNAIYIENDGAWAIYNNGVGVPYSNSTKYVAPGQGFFVNVKDDGSTTGSLGMNNDVRVHNPSTFFKNAVTNMVRLQVSGNGYTDEAVVRFLPEATAGFDGDYDAYKLFGDLAESAQLYLLGSSELAINALPETKTVPVGMRVGVGGVYTIAATEVNGIPAIFLEDTKTGLITDLLKDSCSFSFSPGEKEQRFVLHFAPAPDVDWDNSVADIYSYSHVIHVNFQDKIKGRILIYNITGKLVATIPSAQGSNKIRLVHSGNYFVKVISENASLVKMVFVQ